MKAEWDSQYPEFVWLYDDDTITGSVSFVEAGKMYVDRVQLAKEYAAWKNGTPLTPPEEKKTLPHTPDNKTPTCKYCDRPASCLEHGTSGFAPEEPNVTAEGVCVR